MGTIQSRIMLAMSLLLLTSVSSPAQELSPVFNFLDTNDLNPMAGLLPSGGTLYGTAFGSPYNGSPKSVNLSGAVFKLNTDGTGFTNFYIFSPVSQNTLTNTDGANSAAQPVLSGNRLYGTTERGGFYAHGTVFGVNTDGMSFTNLHNFTGTNEGTTPDAGLVLSGVTLLAQPEAAAPMAMARCSESTPMAPVLRTCIISARLVLALPTAMDRLRRPLWFCPATRCMGRPMRVAPGESARYSPFKPMAPGSPICIISRPFSARPLPLSLYQHRRRESPGRFGFVGQQTVHGTTSMGGNSSDTGSTTSGGTLFALNTDGTGFTNLRNLNYTEGNNPYAGLVLSGSTLYGTMLVGGNLSQKGGTLSAINTDGTGFAVVHTFTPRLPTGSGPYTNADGATPAAGLVLSGSTLFGTTQSGGTNATGTVFALNLAAASPTIQFTATPANGVPPLAVQFNAPAVDSAKSHPYLELEFWRWHQQQHGAKSIPFLYERRHFHSHSGLHQYQRQHGRWFRPGHHRSLSALDPQ